MSPQRLLKAMAANRRDETMNPFDKLSREQLVARLEAMQAALEGDASETQRLMHNLQVHQIELEMQNRELRESQAALEKARHRYAELYDFAPVGYLTLDRTSAIREINLTAAEMLSCPRSEILGSPLTAFLGPGNVKNLLEHLNEAFQSGKPATAELKIKGKRGRLIDVRLESVANAHEDTVSCFTAVIDISVRKKAEEELRRAYDHMEDMVQARTAELASTNQALQEEIEQRASTEEELRQIFENSLEAILVADSSRKIVSANLAFTRLTGFAADETTSQDLAFLVSEHERARYRSQILPELEKLGQWQGEIVLRRKDGDSLVAWESISVVGAHKEKPAAYLCLFSDISVLKQAAQQFERLAYADPLTGLPNRLAFLARLDNAIARAKRHAQSLALLYVDVDDFKRVNDSFGHEYGDHLLKVLAERFSGSVREEDTVARLGGDEFVIILDELHGRTDAAALAQKIMAVSDRPVKINGIQLNTSVSIGIGIYPDDAPDSTSLVRAADEAMYAVKEHGRHGYSFHSES